MDQILAGRRVAILVEHTFIWPELDCYLKRFPELGAEVDLLTLLWGKPQRDLVPTYDDPNQPISSLRTLRVNKDVADADPDNYDLVIMVANYCAIRFKEILPMGSIGSPADITSPPAVRFFAKAMKNKRIVKGAMCHALLILSPHKELLKGRKVICHTVVLAEVLNAGATFAPANSHVVVDDDLVTARSAADLEAYFQALVETLRQRSTDWKD